jgi:hypothetical protein
MTLNKAILVSVGTFSLLSLYLFVQHEMQMYSINHNLHPISEKYGLLGKPRGSFPLQSTNISSNLLVENEITVSLTTRPSAQPATQKIISKGIEDSSAVEKDSVSSITRGKLVCGGKEVDSEVIYWKRVPGDISYESQLTPHHNEHHEKYITFEYDHGGWNNVRMGMECLIVAAHAMGRTLVLPPQHHLYLLSKNHKHDSGEVKDEMGFEDFFDLNLLKSHEGLHAITTKEYLTREGAPHNNTNAWGRELIEYLRAKADKQPEWSGRYLSFANHDNLTEEVKARLSAFAGERSHVYYDKELQEARLIHFQGGDNHRLLQHFYGMTLQYYY